MSVAVGNATCAASASLQGHIFLPLFEIWCGVDLPEINRKLLHTTTSSDSNLQGDAGASSNVQVTHVLATVAFFKFRCALTSQKITLKTECRQFRYSFAVFQHIATSTTHSRVSVVSPISRTLTDMFER